MESVRAEMATLSNCYFSESQYHLLSAFFSAKNMVLVTMNYLGGLISLQVIDLKYMFQPFQWSSIVLSCTGVYRAGTGVKVKSRWRFPILFSAGFSTRFSITVVGLQWRENATPWGPRMWDRRQSERFSKELSAVSERFRNIWSCVKYKSMTVHIIPSSLL